MIICCYAADVTAVTLHGLFWVFSDSLVHTVYCVVNCLYLFHQCLCSSSLLCFAKTLYGNSQGSFHPRRTRPCLCSMSLFIFSPLFALYAMYILLSSSTVNEKLTVHMCNSIYTVMSWQSLLTLLNQKRVHH